MPLREGTIVQYPAPMDEPAVGVIVSHEDWERRYGKADGLGPENWGDDEWVGVWFPGETDMLGEHGDLDRANIGFFVPYEGACNELVSSLVRLALKPVVRGTVKATVRPNLAINVFINSINREEQ